MNHVQAMIIILAISALFLIPSFYLITQLCNDEEIKVEESSDTRFIKTEIKMKLLVSLRDYANTNKLNTEQFSEMFKTTHSTVINILDLREDKFTIDFLISMVLKTGTSVELVTKINYDQ